MLESSKDILFIVLAVSIFLFTVFICWAIYYIAMILREAKKIVADVRKKIELVESLIMALKEKLESTSSHMKLLVETVANVAEYFKERRGEKKAKKKK
ncbi:MAG: hypothetical protein A2Y82_02700 [Candidatus Buchananbacteria bacterium RBG_13_36_9]|uniref:DUF948 domain-containing protein n=1 Tax=Candidatus Buchananbacteria bacterium RBG_13_36_9 TaxID=1797530 RepID=A0A1G1XP86_9BACT|nr:MAG: hypothetical protein A2Y82_02700 [Candidatus Buchananbacteria bacterium RBG_13_36_9]